VADAAARPAPPPGKGARTRKAILVAAGEAFARKGADATTVDEVAEAAGVSVGTIYKYFPSKEVLGREFISEAFDTAVEYFGEAHRRASPIERVLAAGDAYFRFSMEHPAAARFARARMLEPGSAGQTDEITAALAGRLHDLVMTIAADLKESIDAGEIPPVPIDEAMIYLWGSWNGVITLTLRQDEMRVPPELAARALGLGRRVLEAGLASLAASAAAQKSGLTSTGGQK
jgi:TetR/AcrR family transcriptional regulator